MSGLKRRLATVCECGCQPYDSQMVGKVQILSSDFKEPADMEPGERGVLIERCEIEDDGPLSPDQYLQRMTDLFNLRTLYELYYNKAGGRQLEKALLNHFDQVSEGTDHRHLSKAARFQSVVRQAIEKQEGVEEDSALMSLCLKAVRKEGRFDPEEYMRLQRLLVHCNTSLAHDQSLFKTKAGVQKVAARAAEGGFDKYCGCVKHIVSDFAEALAEKMPAA